MQKISVIQKNVIINYATYKMNFVRVERDGEIEDLEVIDFDSKPGVFEVVLSDTEYPTLNFENLAIIQVPKKDVFTRMEKEEGGCVSGSYIWKNFLTNTEKLERCLPEITEYFNMVES